MDPQQKIYNGIDGATGRYLPSPDQKFAEEIRPALSPAELREYRWWVERYGIDDPDRAPAQDVDPKSIASSGWGVVFAYDVGPEVQEALAPLLKHRQDQAGPYFKRYILGPQPSKQAFLSEQKAGAGPADPKKVPYYLLLVGDPRSIPFRFQYELDMQYAVGRIHFEKTEDYAAYAQSVVDAETKKGSLPEKQVAFFGVSNPDDPATLKTSQDLITPLAEVITKDRSAWPVRTIMGEDAKKAQLARILGGGEAPAFLFTASHGMRFPMDHPKFFTDQGALLCQDWPGPQKWQSEITSDFYFSGDDVGSQSMLGMIAFFYACHSAGTPQVADFGETVLGKPETIAPYPFLSRLPQQLLCHPQGGALAVVGHIERAWTISFSWSDTAQIDIFENTLKRLLDGHPLGSAMEFVNQRYAELSVELSGLLTDRINLLSPSRTLITSVSQANNDARNFVVIGDPAVRLIGTA